MMVIDLMGICLKEISWFLRDSKDAINHVFTILISIHLHCNWQIIRCSHWFGTYHSRTPFGSQGF